MVRVRLVMIGVVAGVTVLLGQGETASSDLGRIPASSKISSSTIIQEFPLTVDDSEASFSYPPYGVSPRLVLAWMQILDKKKANQKLADAIALVANEDPVPKEAAARLVSIAYHESHFDLKAKSKPSDPAKAIGAFQISLEWIKKADRESFLTDPVVQSRLALMLVRDSQKRCGDLSQYASGSCSRGGEEAMKREMVSYKLLFETYIDLNEPLHRHSR